MVVAGPIDEISARLAQQQQAASTGHAPPTRPGVHPWQAPPGQAPLPTQQARPVAAPTPQRRVVKLRVLGSPQAAAETLTGGPGILDVHVFGAVVQVGFTGDDSKVAQIVSHLVHRNFGIVSVEQDRNELERIFLEATAQQGHQPHHGGAS